MLDKTKVSRSATALLVAYAISLPVAQSQTNANEKQVTSSAVKHSKTEKPKPKPKPKRTPKPKPTPRVTKTHKPSSIGTSTPVVVASQRPTHSSRSNIRSDSYYTSVGQNQAFAKTYMAEKYGWSGDQVGCLVNLWNRESGWRQSAHNPSSGAHGIPQALPGSKMASAGADWYSNPQTQIKWGLSYISSRYGTPCSAMGFWYNHNWY